MTVAEANAVQNQWIAEALGVPILLTPTQAASYAGVSLVTIYRWIATGAIRVDGTRWVNPMRVVGPSLRDYLAFRAAAVPECHRLTFKAA